MMLLASFKLYTQNASGDHNNLINCHSFVLNNTQIKKDHLAR